MNTVNMYDQEEKLAHERCWAEYRDESEAWWFDFGERCRHVEWHD